MNGDFLFVNTLGPQDGLKLPEASSQDGFNEAVEEIVCALNIIARFDSQAMENAFFRNGWQTNQHCDECAIRAIRTAQNIREWLVDNPNFERRMADLRVARLDYEGQPKLVS